MPLLIHRNDPALSSVFRAAASTVSAVVLLVAFCLCLSGAVASATASSVAASDPTSPSATTSASTFQSVTKIDKNQDVSNSHPSGGEEDCDADCDTLSSADLLDVLTSPSSRAAAQTEEIMSSTSGDAAASSSAAVRAPKPIHGHDTDGAEYEAVEQMWAKELVGDVNDKQTGWYGKAISYWEKVPPTVDGVLGGLSSVHDDDVKESSAFIKSLGADVGRVRALDCGAGIGRLSRTLLIPLGFSTVDLLEPVPHMLEQAKREIDADKAGRFILASMQDPTAFAPTPTYDLIIIQWAAIYLTDADFASFLARCKAALNPGGVIFFKENLSTGQHFVVDKDDSSLTRSDAHYKQIFAAGGVTLIKEKLQKAWPKNLFPVKMYALQ